MPLVGVLQSFLKGFTTDSTRLSYGVAKLI